MREKRTFRRSILIILFFLLLSIGIHFVYPYLKRIILRKPLKIPSLFYDFLFIVE